MVQQQLDSAAVQEMELKAHILELEEMNQEVAEECRNATKDKRDATKSRDNAKQLAQRRLDKYRAGKEANDAMKDELACVVKAKAKQGQVLERYT